MEYIRKIYIQFVLQILNKECVPVDPQQQGFDAFLEEISQKARPQEFHTKLHHDVEQSVNKINIDLTKFKNYKTGKLSLPKKEKLQVAKLGAPQAINKIIDNINKNQFNEQEIIPQLVNFTWIHILQNIV